MDRIEELMKNARPHVVVPEHPSGIPTAVPPTSAIHAVAAPAAGNNPGGDNDWADGELRPFTDAPRLAAGRNSRTALKAAVAGLAAAAVITVGVVAGNMGRPASAPAPAASQSPSVLATARPTPSSPASPIPTPSGPAQSAPASTAVAPPAESPVPAEPSPPVVTPTGSALPPLPAGWSTYSSTSGKVSFDHPGTWTVVPQTGGTPGAVNLEVKDKAGKLVAMLTYGGKGGVGGACTADPVPYTVLDYATVDVPYNPQVPDSVTPRFAFRAMQEAGGVTASYGLTSTVGGQDGKSCMIYNLVNGPAESPIYMFASGLQMTAGNPGQADSSPGAMTFASLADARAYMKSAEYTNAKRMIMSLRISDG